MQAKKKKEKKEPDMEEVSVDNGSWYQNWWPEFNLQDPDVEENRFLQAVLWSYTWDMANMHLHTIHKYKMYGQNSQLLYW